MILEQGNYYAAGTGLLFGFTYLFVAINNVFNLDRKPFAVFSSFVAVNAVIFGIVEGVTGNTTLGITADWRWAVYMVALGGIVGKCFLYRYPEEESRQVCPFTSDY